jgi:hypothetical protein
MYLGALKVGMTFNSYSRKKRCFSRQHNLNVRFNVQVTRGAINFKVLVIIITSEFHTIIAIKTCSSYLYYFLVRVILFVSSNELNE